MADVMTVWGLGWLAWMLECVGQRRKHYGREPLDRARVSITMTAEALAGHYVRSYLGGLRNSQLSSDVRVKISVSRRDARMDG